MKYYNKQIAYNRTKRTAKAKYIVIHDTANSSKGANALANYRYFSSGNRGSSADFFIDDTCCYQINNYQKYYTWHCGDGHGKYGITNANSIGIEICVNSDGNYANAVTNAISVCRDLMQATGIDIDHVVRHYDASRKCCPASMSGNNWAAWKDFKKRLGGNTMTSGRNSAYQYKNGIHIMRIPTKDFYVQYWDRAKKTSIISNYANGGYFGNYKEAGHFFTLPVGNLACDFYVNVSPVARDYLKKIGKIEGNKLYIDNKKHKMSTLFVYQNGMAQIEATTHVPEDAKYAISGAPVIRLGKDVSWKKEVLTEGWDGSIARPTWHGFLATKASVDNYVYYIGMQTRTSNLWTSSEAFLALKNMGFYDAIKIDGGGSYIMDVDGKNKAVTAENRQINTIVRFL